MKYDNETGNIIFLLTDLIINWLSVYIVVEDKQVCEVMVTPFNPELGIFTLIPEVSEEQIQ